MAKVEQMDGHIDGWVVRWSGTQMDRQMDGHRTGWTVISFSVSTPQGVFSILVIQGQYAWHTFSSHS